MYAVRFRREAFTLVELLVVIAVIGSIMSLLLPAVQSARETARRMKCANQVKQINLGLQSYMASQNFLPPGCVIDKDWEHTYYHYTYDIIDKARNGQHGTSWMLQILPYIEQQDVFDQWDFEKNVFGNEKVANTDIAAFYCPSRRREVGGPQQRMLLAGFTAGGTDYGGCLGRINSCNNECYSGGHECAHKLVPAKYFTTYGTAPEKIGAFSPNRAVRHRDIDDGTSQTIFVGELQRLLPPDGAVWYDKGSAFSNDGWAVGGISTLFVTTRGFEKEKEQEEHNDQGQKGRLNNGFFESAGSEHPGGANFGLADGSVRFIDEKVDQDILAWMGSISDGMTFETPE